MWVVKRLAMEFTSWKAQLERERGLKDNFFKAHPESPIPPSKREEFKELHYYPLNIDYRLELNLHKHDEKTWIQMQIAHSEEQEYVRWGEFRFTLQGKECRLQAYKRGEEKWLFIPFRDETSGNGTYGAGRYLDFQPEEHYLGDGRWIIDFNKAYNPWCGYNESYTCPLTPPENWLEVPIYAGEKKIQ